MKKYMIFVSILLLANLSFGDICSKEIEKVILQKFYDANLENRDYPRRTMIIVHKESPHYVWIYLNEEFPEERIGKAIVTAIEVVGEFKKEGKCGLSTLHFHIWNEEKQQVEFDGWEEYAYIYAYECKMYLEIKSDEGRQEFIEDRLIFVK